MWTNPACLKHGGSGAMTVRLESCAHRGGLTPHMAWYESIYEYRIQSELRMLTGTFAGTSPACVCVRQRRYLCAYSSDTPPRRHYYFRTRGVNNGAVTGVPMELEGGEELEGGMV